MGNHLYFRVRLELDSVKCFYHLSWLICICFSNFGLIFFNLCVYKNGSGAVSMGG